MTLRNCASCQFCLFKEVLDDDIDIKEESYEDVEEEEEAAEEEDESLSLLACSYLNFEAEEREPVELVTMPPGFSSSSRAQRSTSRFRKRMTAYLKGVRRAWRFACGRMLAREGDAAAASLTACHLGLSKLTAPDLRQHLVRLARMLRHFALLQPEFAELSAHDQRQLLARNAPLFLQFVLGRYLSAESPADQIAWLLLGEDEEEEEVGRSRAHQYRGLNLRRIVLEDLSESAGLFTVAGELSTKIHVMRSKGGLCHSFSTTMYYLDDEDESSSSDLLRYSHLSDRLRRLCVSSANGAFSRSQSAPLVALACLFRTGFSAQLDESEQVN